MSSETNATNSLDGKFSRGDEYIFAVRDVKSSSFKSNKDRVEALQATYDAVAKLETPWETYVRIYANQPGVIAGFKILKDLRLMMKWNEKGNIPMTSVQLADLIGNCDSELLDRFLRLLTANGFFERIHGEKFRPSEFCIELANPDFDTLTNLHYTIGHDAYGLMAQHLAEKGYQNPTDAKDTVLKKFIGHEDFWSYMEENPEIGESFNVLQKVSSTKEPLWTEIYPYETLVDESDPSLPLLVDVGGGIGQDLSRFYKLYPETAPRLYLEDLQTVIADANAKSLLPASINKLEYSFFTPQPVKGARAYYMHHIIHDWPDQLACKILEMQKSAMKPGYSRLLIHDQILDDEKCLMGPAAYDITMMVWLAGKERTEKQWLALFDSVGLKVIKFWKKPPNTFGVIEVEVPWS